MLINVLCCHVNCAPGAARHLRGSRPSFIWRFDYDFINYDFNT